MKQYQTALGRSLPAVAVGCMRIADLTDEQADRLMMTAIEGGADYFDHADIYGGGACESRFGAFLHAHPGLRDRIQIQTKCGICKGFYDSSCEHILKSVDDSLKRLGVEYVDALLIHRPDALAEPQEIARAFSLLKAAGKVRFFGVSNHNPMQIEALQEALDDKLVINQMQLSVMHTGLIDHGINVNTTFKGSEDRDGGTLEFCKRRHIVLQAWSPFQYDCFEGPFIGNPLFPELNRTLSDIADAYAVTPTAIAVAWLVRIPAMVQVVTGTTKPERMREILLGANTPLSREDWYAIYRAAGNQLP